MSNITLDYYDRNSAGFTTNTIDVKFTDIQDRFLEHLDKGALILDFGCGSGRDSRYFLSKGYRVEACDGSHEMVRIASETAGIPVKQMLFGELDEVDKYDGIFACASILHVSSEELPDIIRRMERAAKKSGVIYVSFKYGSFEGERNGRYFTDLDENGLKRLLETAAQAPAPDAAEAAGAEEKAPSAGAEEKAPSASAAEAPVKSSATPLEIIDLWVTGDARPGRSSEKWLNAILKK